MRRVMGYGLRPVSLLAVAALVVVGGCGGDEDGTAAASATTGAEAISGSPGASTTLDLSKVSGDPFCLEIAKESTTLTGGGLDDQADYEAAAEVFEGLAAKAPEAIKGDMSLLASWAATFAPYVGRVNDLTAKAGKGAAAEQEELAQDLDALRVEIETKTSQFELDVATKNLDAWTKANCVGLEATSGG